MKRLRSTSGVDICNPSFSSGNQRNGQVEVAVQNKPKINPAIGKVKFMLYRLGQDFF